MTLCYCMNGLVDVLCQISRMSILSNRMQKILWLKCWSADYLCKKCLKQMPYEGEHLFGTSFEKENLEIVEGGSGENTLLDQKKRLVLPHVDLLC